MYTENLWWINNNTLVCCMRVRISNDIYYSSEPQNNHNVHHFFGLITFAKISDCENGAQWNLRIFFYHISNKHEISENENNTPRHNFMLLYTSHSYCFFFSNWLEWREKERIWTRINKYSFEARAWTGDTQMNNQKKKKLCTILPINAHKMSFSVLNLLLREWFTIMCECSAHF